MTHGFMENWFVSGMKRKMMLSLFSYCGVMVVTWDLTYSSTLDKITTTTKSQHAMLRIHGLSKSLKLSTQPKLFVCVEVVVEVIMGYLFYKLPIGLWII